MLFCLMWSLDRTCVMQVLSCYVMQLLVCAQIGKEIDVVGGIVFVVVVLLPLFVFVGYEYNCGLCVIAILIRFVIVLELYK